MNTYRFKIEAPYYPIVYVRGYAMRAAEREETFNDTYYGFSATSVEKRQAPAPQYFEADVFEGQLIRLMKIRDYGYADSVNRGIEIFHSNPSRSVWVSRFYDQDVFRDTVRRIEEHAEDLYTLVCQTIPERLRKAGVDLGENDRDYRVILIAHSMGGLVCRTLIQNLIPHVHNKDPKDWIYRFVTMGTPHRGINLGRIPDVIENLLTSKLNPFDANIFKEERMREYLKLDPTEDLHSLGDPSAKHAFPVKRCLCIIGSDYRSYGVTRELTGSFSDGLVKQDYAYVVAGPKPPEEVGYPDERRSFWANVHRAHSGTRGIVNSYESYENIQRFLFGDTRAEISLDDIKFGTTAPTGNDHYFYDFEFLFSIRRSGTYLHRRQQDPCENAIRLERAQVPPRLLLHTAFVNSRLRDEGDKFSHFGAKIRIVEHRVRDGFLWDHEYPERPIYNESVEVRLGDEEVSYRWLSEGDNWAPMTRDANGVFRVGLRAGGAVTGVLSIKPGLWPDTDLTHDGVETSTRAG
ncbi:MAG: hypothetical protein Q7W02_20445 [Candidatus Rokubacteria bacterium]|nr:hypothetical protein [Candidatus Rokubacteria bacterium]